VFPVSGIWRWRLMMEGAGKSGIFFDTFIAKTINWLTSSAEKSPLTITTESGAYLSGQEIKFEARLYDTVFSPVDSAEITLDVDNNPATKILFRETKPALYSGVLQGLPEGKHTYRAVAFHDGKRFAETTGSLSIDKFPLEMLDSAPDPELMKTIAARTGGINVTISGIDSVLTRIKPQTVFERHENTLNFHLNLFILLLIVCFLTIEWSIRKYRGMI
jgi:hypothetical protein